jgi:hypothetical protein
MSESMADIQRRRPCPCCGCNTRSQFCVFSLDACPLLFVMMMSAQQPVQSPAQLAIRKTWRFIDISTGFFLPSPPCCIHIRLTSAAGQQQQPAVAALSLSVCVPYVEDVVQAKHVGLDRITQSPILHQPESSVLYTTTTTALMPHISKGRELLLLDRRGPTPSSSPMEKLLVPSSMTAQTAWHKSFLDSPLRPLNVYLYYSWAHYI